MSGEEDYGIGGYAMAGQFTGDGDGGFSAGVADVNEGAGDPVLAGDLTSAEYFVNSNGYAGFEIFSENTAGLTTFGVYLVDPALNIADPNSSTGGGGALMIELDDDNNGTGIIVPQTSGATFAGNYAITQDGAYETEDSFSFFDLVGQVNSDGTSTFTGLADFNDVLKHRPQSGYHRLRDVPRRRGQSRTHHGRGHSRGRGSTRQCHPLPSEQLSVAAR